MGYNYPSIKAWKDTAVRRTGTLESENTTNHKKSRSCAAQPHFLSPHEITVNRRHLSAHYFLIATGSTMPLPDIAGLSKVDYLTSRTAPDPCDHPNQFASSAAVRPAASSASC